MPQASPVCLDDHSCIENRRVVFARVRVGAWDAPRCQSCPEGRKREQALGVLRPKPKYCSFPECGSEIGNENVSGYCRRHVQKAARKRR